MDKCESIIRITIIEVIKKVLVTSDSMRFIEHIKSIPDVYAFPGKIVHMDWSKGENYETYLKSFVDFYLIGGARKVFSVGTDKMYKSDFPKYAAMIGNIAFERILLAD